MTDKLKVVIAQLNFLVGDVKGNTRKIIETITESREKTNPDLILFGELAISGYPPEDLLEREDFMQACVDALAEIQSAVNDECVIVGLPMHANKRCYNAAAIITRDEPIQYYYKQCLPNYGVFDEKRYFIPGSQTCVIKVKDFSLGVTICEDIWRDDPIADCAREEAHAIVCLNASPYHFHKYEQRVKTVRKRCETHKLPILYTQIVGGQDEFLFDGGSFVCDSRGQLVAQANCFEEQLLECTLSCETDAVTIVNPVAASTRDPWSDLYDALVLGVRDYVRKNGFREVVLGVSGGIDSALALTIAVDALGAEQVEALWMPSEFSSRLSHDLTVELCHNLGVATHTLSIDTLFQETNATLAPRFVDTKTDVTEENLQARLRGLLLMAVSNKFNKLVLTTGNKSEYAVGYATLYGDMVGAFGVLKDVYKSKVFELARYRNTRSHVIPSTIITRAPTAELAPNQLDEDALPPYDLLDAILEGYIEFSASADDLVEQGFARDTVERVIRLVKINEYKRRQAAPGVRVTQKAFGRERRMPITSGF